MRLTLGPRANEFYDLLGQGAGVALEIARKAEIRFREFPSSPVSQAQIKELEHKGDRITSELIGQLNSQHITPFDRDDLFRLAGAIDDVTDAIENASELLGLYGIEGPTKHALEQCRLLVAATEQVDELLRGLKGRRGSAPQIEEIKRLEDEGDRIKRDAVASLFKDDRIDPLIVVRWKDVYEALENAIDACERVAHLVGNLLVKNN
jgi:predicted phosphate transport protein (TIGR00153 family)